MSVRCTFGFVCLINFYKYFGALHPFKGQSPEVFVAFNVISASLGAEHRNIQLIICEIDSSLSRTHVNITFFPTNKRAYKSFNKTFSMLFFILAQTIKETETAAKKMKKHLYKWKQPFY